MTGNNLAKDAEDSHSLKGVAGWCEVKRQSEGIPRGSLFSLCLKTILT